MPSFRPELFHHTHQHLRSESESATEHYTETSCADFVEFLTSLNTVFDKIVYSSARLSRRVIW